MPFGARPSALTPPWMRPSPSVPGGTPDGLMIATPANSAPTPSGTEIVRACKPSLMPAVQLQRTRLMAQGKFEDMLKSMDLGEQKLGGLLRDALPEDDPPGNDWSQQNLSQPIEERLVGALLSNSFSDVTEAQLPVPVSKVAKAAQRSPSDLLLESLGFAIMGRSVELVRSCLKKARKQTIDVGTIHPLHIATSYLDGGRTCCLIIAELCAFLRFKGRYRDCITNEHGHTVLDNIFLSVLRSHSNAPLSVVEGSLGERARYAGSEVDICGRWSADSHCYRILLASGERTIPPTWKHKFCHTSIQAVCHTISILLRALPTSTIKQSGLFRHTCPNPSCGRRMQLGALHALVVVAMFLATYGCADEDLFGIIACYLCMTRAGVDPLEEACLSAPQILGFQTDDICIHAEMTPSELATQLREKLSSITFGNAVTTGWNCLVTIMRMAESAGRRQTRMTSSDSNDSNSNSAFGDEGSPAVAVGKTPTVVDVDAVDCDEDPLHHDYQEEHALSRIEFGGGCYECEDRAHRGDLHFFLHESGLGHAWAAI
ncbi:hypothetical protein LTR24_000539 [Lithohypha guttulata]|uniref:Uncharacterized protein n=1 Tax=Lithohypha guttulata TaxID=1690604 RepID=A0ABR0KN57_9EURO|nr:hypothetical protein LTR24_000539 [Lithohypha guttulata]